MESGTAQKRKPWHIPQMTMNVVFPSKISRSGSNTGTPLSQKWLLHFFPATTTSLLISVDGMDLSR